MDRHFWIGEKKRGCTKLKIYRTISDGQMVENWQGFTGSVSTR
jgi:hypothetical protein